MSKKGDTDYEIWIKFKQPITLTIKIFFMFPTNINNR